jgi:hypothetical protein
MERRRRRGSGRTERFRVERTVSLDFEPVELESERLRFLQFLRVLGTLSSQLCLQFLVHDLHVVDFTFESSFRDFGSLASLGVSDMVHENSSQECGAEIQRRRL